MQLFNRALLIGFLILISGPSTMAFVFIQRESSPTVGVPDYQTITLTAHSDEGPIVGFNFSGLDPWGGDAGFIGRLGQVLAPVFRDDTVFNDFNPFFPFLDRDVSEDSQFKFRANRILVQDKSENLNHLQATFSSLPGSDFGFEVEFAQISVFSQTGLLDTPLLLYSGSIDVRKPDGEIESKPFRTPLLLINVPTGSFEIESVPTEGLTGFTTHTISARTESWNQIVGADLVLSGGRGIFGPMNQVEVGGQPILTADQGSAAERARDSHFLVAPADAQFGMLSESPNSLQGSSI